MIQVDIVKAVVAATGNDNTKADAVETVIQSLKDAMRRMANRIEKRRWSFHRALA